MKPVSSTCSARLPPELFRHIGPFRAKMVRVGEPAVEARYAIAAVTAEGAVDAVSGNSRCGCGMAECCEA